MKQVKYPAFLSVKLEPETRRAVEILAEREKMSLAEAARELLNVGIKARGLVW